jgi:FKBP-type peptidyl-prolyl cis-trans isomerase 2
MQKGEFVRIDYVGRIKETREIFDLTIEETAKKEKVFDPRIKYKAVPVIIGEGFVLKGMDKELEHMKVGDKKSLSLKPDEAFGERDPKLIKVIPKSVFRKQRLDPLPGMVINMDGYKGKIQSCESGRVRVDFNNPLAGKELEYEVEIREKIETPDAQIKSIFEFLGIDDAEIVLNGNEAEIKTRSLPQSLKEQVAALVTKHVSNDGKKIENIKFSEVYGKKAEQT